jgi:trehalose synthase
VATEPGDGETWAGDDTRPMLRHQDRLRSGDERLREEAAHQLGEIGDPLAVRELILLLSDSRTHVRLEAATSLGKLGDRSAVRPLLDVLDDPSEDADVCAAAIAALGHLGEPQTTGPISDMIDHADSVVRASVARALGDLEDVDAVPLLITVLRNDPNGDVRRAAAEALTAIGGPDAERALRRVGRIWPSDADVHWLESRSMLHNAHHLVAAVSGKHLQWRNTYARPRPRDFAALASVWFTNYPKALITQPNESILSTLANADLLSTFHEIGIDGIHTGPMKRAGGIAGRTYTSSTDGFFDRIELSVDPLFGSDQEYAELTRTAKQVGLSIIGDLIPAHTGKGPDFRLAERAYQNYPGLYTMVEIPEEDWWLLGDVPDGADCVNLPSDTVQLLEDRGYIPGPLEITPFYYPGIKDTDWSATDIVACVDGRHRRWVYLHVFKAGQPSLNWLDPTFAAQRIVLADAVQSLVFLGDTALRIDASPLLGVEVRPGLDKAWIEGHPLAEASSNLIAMMIRKLGGYSFQEINASLDDLKRFVTWGPDLSYDFTTRPSYLYAIATGDARPLRMMLRLMLNEGLDPGIFVHALQNHDELMFDSCHLRRHGDEDFAVGTSMVRGKALYDAMYDETKRVVMDGCNYMREFSNLGFCGTLASFIAAACGISDPYHMTSIQADAVRQLHLLAAVFNAMQPGVFALSGWDLVGALPVSSHDVESLLEDGDYRWLNRGAFDLMGVNPAALSSAAGLPKAEALYGALPDQLRDPMSFASRLKEMLRCRRDGEIALSNLAAVPEPDAQGVLLMVMQRPHDHGWALTAINFGREGATETIRLPPGLADATAHEVFSTDQAECGLVQISGGGDFELALGARHARVFLIDDAPVKPAVE